MNAGPASEEKVSGTFCAQHPKGLSGKRHLTPFRAGLVAGALLFSAAGVLAGLALGGFFAAPDEGVTSPAPEMADALDPLSGAQTYDLHYGLAASYLTGLMTLRGIAIDTADRIYVAGDSTVKVFDEQGRPAREWQTSGPAQCAAVGRSGNVYVGLLTRVEKYDASGTLLASWSPKEDEPGRLKHVTSIATAEPNVYVADAGSRLIHRFAADGDFIQDIGRRDPEAGVPGLIVPSPYLDCDVDSQGVLHVANPGRLRVERYTPDGRLLGWWGKAGRHPEEFSGCCNPTNIAVARQGWVVTSEKGIRRVKVYDSAGRLLALAGAEIFGNEPESGSTCVGPYGPGLDLVVDSRGRIHVSDPASRSIRVFAPRVER